MEKAVLIHVHLSAKAYRDAWPAEELEKELRQLSESAGLQILKEVSVRKDVPVPSTFIGRGKVEELHLFCHRNRPDAVVFGCDLGALQQKNLEDQLGVKVIDRTQLILDIFAQRARSQEGKVQVELAQLNYLLPRLIGRGTVLSRLGGGIGTRGPGEQKLEIDRRRIRARIGRLEKELRAVSRRRGVARKRRVEEQVPVAALVGYTNAGKSTLLNALTRAGTLSRDQLFTTLDPLTRRLELPSGQAILVADTVGFLHRLPRHLIEAFRATLEEVRQSHLILHVADAASSLLEEKISAVEEILAELEADDKPLLLILNQIDRLSREEMNRLARLYPEGILVSARSGEGLDRLRDRLGGLLQLELNEVEIRLIGPQMGWMSKIYKEGQVLEQRFEGEGLLIRARISSGLRGRLSNAGIKLSS